MAKCTPDSIEAAFAQIFEAYEREVDDQLEEDLTYAGESAAGEAAKRSPVGGGNYYGRKRDSEGIYRKVRKSGKHYGKGWEYDIDRDAWGGMSVTVHNTAKPSLTHLLEKGHMARDGSWVGARRHIEDAYELGVKILERRLRG